MHDQPRHLNAPADPWQTTGMYTMPPPTRSLPTDVLDAHSAPIRRPRSPRRRALLIGGGLALALIAGSVAYAGVSYWYGWSSTQPEAVLPATVNAFARMDFAPGLGQRIRLGAIARKFPATTDKDAVEQIKRGLVNDLGLDPLNYDSDIKPWLGDRVGFASWPTPAATGRCELAALASRNDSLATASLSTVRQHKGSARFGFAFSKGYAMYARCPGVDSQAAVDSVLSQAKTQTLAARSDFAGDLSALPAGQAAVAWAHLPDAVTALNGLTSDFGTVDVHGLAGSVMLGGQATSDGLDLRYRAHVGAAPAQPAHDVLAALGALPGGTVLGVSADLAGLPQVTVPTVPTLASRSNLFDLVPALFGSTVSLSASDVTSGALRLVIQAADPARAATIASQLGGPFGTRYPGVVVNRSGTTVTASSTTYQPGSGSLTDSPAFRSVFNGASHDSLVAAYLDVPAVAARAKLSPQEAAQVAPIKAVGFTSGYDGDTLVGLFRVLIP
jgi:Protein of unknown function (DUF3352)